MKRYIKFFILFAASVAAANAQTGENKIKIWPEGKMPGTSAPEFTLDERGRVASVKTPMLELFLVKSQKPAPFVIVCPGGGYNKLAPHEGNKIAKKLNESGISAAVLYYRVPQNPDGALADALRAIRIARQNSLPEYWNIGKIGIMGFSAGANLSARASTNYAKNVYEAIDNMDNLSARPDFTLLIYPAYCDKPSNDKRWNKTKQDPAADYNTLYRLADNLDINKKTPPVFIEQSIDDKAYINAALAYFLAAKRAGVRADMHIFGKGGHGYGLADGESGKKGLHSAWPALAAEWIKEIAKD